MEFTEFRVRCSQLWEDLAKLASPEMEERIKAASKRLESERLKILVVGEFSRGKSTFINALIGEPILPSKVNPTTATINILSGGNSRLGVIEYQDGTETNLELPNKSVNKFLDKFVTTANQEAKNIRLVKLFLPGRLEKIAADIVDTPGVNDLDQMREEITFRYLREADAVILLLDAQQPLSQSERIFLKEKVLGNDINRIVYVINKIDEVLSSSTEEDIPTIIDYVKQRLAQLVGIENPLIYALSAKNALRSRFKNQPDPSPTSFADFENQLIKFAGEQATSGRLQSHLERFAKVFRDQQLILGQEIQALQTEIAEIDGHLHKLIAQQQGIQNQLQKLEEKMKPIYDVMRESITNYSRQRVLKMKENLNNELSSCATEENLEEFRGSVSRHLRDLQLDIENYASKERKRHEKALETEFKEVISPPSSAIGLQKFSQSSLDIPTIDAEYTDYISVEPTFIQGSDLTFGAIAGLIASIFFTPIGGVGAAIVAVWLSVSGRQQENNTQMLNQAKQQISEQLNQNFDLLVQRTSELGEKIARQYSESLRQSFHERGQNNLKTLEAGANTTRAAQSYSKSERENAFNQLKEKIKSLVGIKQSWDALKNDCAV